MDEDTGAICEALGLTDCVEVGRGGFATVHGAWDAVHQRRVAIKVIDGAAATVECRMRFERERGALGRLSHHPGIATLHHSGIAPGGSPFLVMEYLGGGTLADHVETPLSWPEAAGIIACLSGAVETAHRADICHRDIKPENVLRSDFGSWVLADFGIALTSSDPRTRTGEFIASLAHAAPEVFEGASPAPALDIYALGTTLVTMITGRDEFGPDPAESILSTIRRIATTPVASLRPYGVPAGVEALVAAATAKDPAQRPSTCLAFGRALNDELIRAGHPPTKIVVDELGDEDEEDRVSPMTDLRARVSIGAGRSAGARRNHRRGRPFSAAAAGLALGGLAVGGALTARQVLSDGAGQAASPTFDLAIAAPSVVLDVPTFEDEADETRDPLSDEIVSGLVAGGLDDLGAGRSVVRRAVTDDGVGVIREPPSAPTAVASGPTATQGDEAPALAPTPAPSPIPNQPLPEGSGDSPPPTRELDRQERHPLHDMDGDGSRNETDRRPRGDERA